MSIGDIFSDPLGTVGNTFDEVTSGAHTAPTPTVSGSAPGPVTPATWTAPNVGSSGHFHVHRDHLTTAANVIRAALPDLDAAINEVNSHRAAFSSLTTWATGSALGGNLVSAVQGFASAGQDTSGAHGGAAQGLSDSATAYAEAETTSAQSIAKIGGSSGASGPSGPPASSGGASAPASVSAPKRTWM